MSTYKAITALVSKDNNINVYADKYGSIHKRKGYKTFRGMVSQLKRINKLNKLHSFKATYTVTLPLKP